MLKNIDWWKVAAIASMVLNALGGTSIVPPAINLGSQTPTVPCPALSAPVSPALPATVLDDAGVK